MRVLVSPGKPVPIKFSRTVESNNPNTDCNDTERISEEKLLAEFMDQIQKIHQQNAQFNDTSRSADPFSNVNRENNDLLRKFFDEIDRDCDNASCVNPVLKGPKADSLDAGLSQISTNASQPEMDLNRLIGDCAQGNSWSGDEMGFDAHQHLAGSSGDLPLRNNQAEQQQLLMLELQNQLHNFSVLIQQKLRENERREIQGNAQTARESAASTVNEAESVRMQSENADIEIVSTNNSPPICVLNQLNSVCSLESSQCDQKLTITRSIDEVAVDDEPAGHSRKESEHSRQTNRVDKSEGSLRKEKQVRANIHVKRSDVATEKDPIVRGKSKTYSCGECDKAFNRKEHLIKHLRAHSGEKPFKCTDCGNSFSQKSHLTVHKRIHTGEKPFKCTDCGTSFSQKSHLTDHKRIHSGAKPYVCRICNVAFSHKISLSRHLLIHTNERPFICDICNQSFRQKTVLSEHMNIHIGNRPYKCNVCQKTFRQRKALYKHRKVHAQEEE